MSQFDGRNLTGIGLPLLEGLCASLDLDFVCGSEFVQLPWILNQPHARRSAVILIVI